MLKVHEGKRLWAEAYVGSILPACGLHVRRSLQTRTRNEVRWLRCRHAPGGIVLFAAMTRYTLRLSLTASECTLQAVSP